MNLRDLFISTGLFLALGAVALGLMTSVLLDIDISLDFLTILFLITFSVYIVNRGMDVEEDTINQLERIKFIGHYKNSVLIIGILVYTIAIIIASERGLIVVGSVCLPVIIGLFYTIRWVPNGLVKKVGFSRLKDIPLIKNVAVAGIWAYSTVFLLLFYNSLPLILPAVILSVFIFLRCFINTLIFDIRDLIGDREMNIKTLPVIFGAQKAKNLLILLNLSTLILIAYSVFFNILPTFFIFSSFIVIPTNIIIQRANPHKRSMETLCDVYEDANETFVLFFFTYLGYVLMG